MSISSIKKALKNVFQGKLKNLVSLADDSDLDNHLKPLKIGGKTTPMKISEDTVEIGSTLIYDGKEVVSGDIEGTGIKSTGETGGTKFLREDGDGTCSWQTAGGGSSEYYIMQQGRGRCQYNNWYWCSHSTYGSGFYYWYFSTGSSTLPSNMQDSYGAVNTIPKAGNVTSWNVTGNISSTDTVEWALIKLAQPTFGSAGNWTASQIGSTQSAGGTANIQYKWEETGLSVSVAKDDRIVPVFRRTTDNDSTSIYLEVAYQIIIEGS
jgi:hypothetical protein